MIKYHHLWQKDMNNLRRTPFQLQLLLEDTTVASSRKLRYHMKGLQVALLESVKDPRNLKREAAHLLWTYQGSAQSMCGRLTDPVLWFVRHVHIHGWLLDELRREWATWEHYSGNRNYPVPDPEIKGAAAAKYCYIEEMLNSKLWVGDYGRLRTELREYLVTKWR